VHTSNRAAKVFQPDKITPPTLKYESGLIVGEADFVIVHGRFSGFGATVNWIAADIVRIHEGILAEHWDVIQDEATEEQSKSKAPCSVIGFLHTDRTIHTTRINGFWRKYFADLHSRHAALVSAAKRIVRIFCRDVHRRWRHGDQFVCEPCDCSNAAPLWITAPKPLLQEAQRSPHPSLI